MTIRFSGFTFCALLVLAACGNNSGQSTTGAAGATNGGAGNATSASAGSAGVTAGGTSAGSSAGGSAGATVGSGGANAGTAGIGGGSGGGATIGNCEPPSDIYSPIEQLSQTGCVDPNDPTKPIARAVTYEVNSPLWSDSADKLRAFVLPANSKIHVRDCAAEPSTCPAGNADEGRWDFPIGTVMIKIFMFDQKLVETRLFMHMADDSWVGYNYQWSEDQKEATIVDGDRAEVMFNTGLRTVDWHYPSRKDCLDCHNSPAGNTLGPETAQMNRTVNGMNQIDQFAAAGLFETPPKMPYKAGLITPYQLGSPPEATQEDVKARSYLHANCAFCHRPDGLYPNFDLRYDTALKDMKICDIDGIKGAVGTSQSSTILKHGDAMDSLIWQRMNQADPDSGRMPQIGSYVVDADAMKIVGDWIDSISACPE
ncbi:MAG TPA: hypothetical protein VHV51_22440 [Polyangiaceae bacterium]|jgi:uncharacterized repeat protein (TIGR03806 family)|nr:hypothetical protein [Polyangiaceae bacterium]